MTAAIADPKPDENDQCLLCGLPYGMHRYPDPEELDAFVAGCPGFGSAKEQA